jgi:UDP-N-acetylglucosamine diphosphorylase/glucosamine-1-phosphate N-acetyltransferase
MRVCLFEDRLALDLEPLALTRPVFALWCGCTRLADKQYRAFAASRRGALVRDEVAALWRQTGSDSAVNDPAWLHGGAVVLVNGRWLPPAPSALPGEIDAACVGLVGDEVAYAVLGPDQAATIEPDNLEECLARWRCCLPARPAGGCLVRYLWDLVDLNGDEITLDTWLSGPERPRRDDVPLALVGPADRLVIDPTARIDPLVAADTTAGPVVIDRGAVVAPFTRLEGPCYIGPGTHVLGAKVRAGTSLGPGCRIGGEVEASVVLGHSNKYHDGFLGHAYVGEWVNLGAGTSNSDLRNDYGEVRVVVNGALVATGRTKVGCFLGDHVKTGLGTLLNTGTSAGAFCNLLPAGGLLPRHMPSFTSVRNGALVESADVEALLRTAERVMRRRGQALTEAHRLLYGGLFEQTAVARRQAIREAGARRLRRGA